jgi:hypothetical protein
MINRNRESFIGLFGYVYKATIHNLGIETCQITGSQYVGGLIGRADNSIIENCFSVGNIKGEATIGGLVGMIYNSIISKCYSLCAVSGERNIGGLMGTNNGTIQTSYAGGNVTLIIVSAMTNINPTGGFVGTNNGTIINCYATGDMSGTGVTSSNQCFGFTSRNIFYSHYFQ